MPGRRNVEVKILTTKFYIEFLTTKVRETAHPGGPEVNGKSSETITYFL